MAQGAAAELCASPDARCDLGGPHPFVFVWCSPANVEALLESLSLLPAPAAAPAPTPSADHEPGLAPSLAPSGRGAAWPAGWPAEARARLEAAWPRRGRGLRRPSAAFES
eukprot:tig00000042_g15596.t1